MQLIHYRIGQRWVVSGRESISAWIENGLRDRNERVETNGCSFQGRIGFPRNWY